jgi:hypothetical protein
MLRKYINFRDQSYDLYPFSNINKIIGMTKNKIKQSLRNSLFLLPHHHPFPDPGGEGHAV